MFKYNDIFNYVQHEFDENYITFEQAESINNAAYKKYVEDVFTEEDEKDLKKPLKKKISNSSEKIPNKNEIVKTAKIAAISGAGTLAATAIAKKKIKENSQKEILSRSAKKNINTEISNFRNLLNKTKYNFSKEDKEELKYILDRIYEEIPSL